MKHYLTTFDLVILQYSAIHSNICLTFQYEDDAKQMLSEMHDANHKMMVEKRRQAKAMREKRDERLKQKGEQGTAKTGNAKYKS